jgi:hypothetical protein
MSKTSVPRIDPASRPVDGDITRGLRNADPNRWYVLCNPNDPYYGLDHYVGVLGYEIEVKRKGGPFFPGVNASADGTQITRYGQVLVSCPMEQYLAEFNAGQARVDSVMDVIRKHGDPDGAWKGPTGRPAYWVEDPAERPLQE